MTAGRSLPQEPGRRQAHSAHGLKGGPSVSVLFLQPFYVLCITSIFALCACSAFRGQRKASDPRELELQMVVSGPVGAGHELRSPG